MDRPDNFQLEIYRKMSPAEKLKLAEKLYWDARKIRESVVRSLHPELSDAEVKEKVKKEFIHARSD
jgi:hypothetical protein